MLNYANVLAYGSYFGATFGCSRAGLPDNAVLSDKYQTLITPAPYAFAIWGIIFTAELVWTIAQLTPSYRSHPLVVKGVGYGFAGACLAQAAWTVVFSLERIGLSMIAMLGILAPLLSVVVRMKTSSVTTATTSGYWLLKFPFEIHMSWVLCATCLNANVLLVSNGASATGQTVLGAVCLVLLFACGIYALTRKKPQRVWTVPCVVAWAALAIARELSDPRDQILERFPESTISRTEMASSVVGYLLVLVVTLALLRDRFFPGNGDDDDDCDSVLDSDADSEERNAGGYSSLGN